MRRTLKITAYCDVDFKDDGIHDLDDQAIDAFELDVQISDLDIAEIEVFDET